MRVCICLDCDTHAEPWMWSSFLYCHLFCFFSKYSTVKSSQEIISNVNYLQVMKKVFKKQVNEAIQQMILNTIHCPEAFTGISFWPLTNKIASNGEMVFDGETEMRTLKKKYDALHSCEVQCVSSKWILNHWPKFWKAHLSLLAQYNKIRSILDCLDSWFFFCCF